VDWDVAGFLAIAAGAGSDTLLTGARAVASASRATKEMKGEQEEVEGL
jgi:hypothetical protein